MTNACSAFDQLSKDERISLLEMLGFLEPQRFRWWEIIMHDGITMTCHINRQGRLYLV